MDVLDVLGRAGGIGKISAGAVLAALGFAGGSAGVHQKQRIFSRHGHRVNPLTIIFLQYVVDKIITPLHHGCGARCFARIALPDQHLVDFLAVLFGQINGDVGVFLMIQEISGTIIRIHDDQHTALGVHDSVGTGPSAEAPEDLGMNNAETGTGQHGDGKFG